MWLATLCRKNKRFKLCLLTTWFVMCCNAQSPTTVIEGRTCIVKPPENVSLVPGWPFQIPCFRSKWENDTHADAALEWCYSTGHNDTLLQCLAINISNGEIVFNASTSCFEDLVIDLGDVYPTNLPSLRLAIVADTVPSGIEEGSCEVYDYTFLSEAEPSTCRESADAFDGETHSVNDGKTIKHMCPGVVDDQVNVSVTSFSWLYNCHNLTGNRTRIVRKYHLQVENFNYDDAGIYTCVASYKGRKRYFHVSTCVNPSYVAGAPTITCEKKEAEAEIGGHVTLTCTVSFGPGIMRGFGFELSWLTSSREKCQSLDENKTKYIRNMSIGCNYFVEDPFIDNCVQNYTGQHAVVTANLILRDVQNNDIGDYVITVVNILHMNDSETIRLIERPKPPPVRLIAGLVAGISLLIIIVFILLYVFRFYVKVYWKRWFGSYEQDVFRHEAYVSYHASQGLDQEAMNMVRDARTTTIKELRSLGFQRLYDQYESFEPGMLVEVVMNAIDQSHRVVIILSYEYIQAGEAVFNLQQAVLNNIETGKKIIFILLPGTREAVTQRVNEQNGRYRMIKRMLDTCHAIQWSMGDDFDSKRFRLNLEYAMPKLRNDNIENSNLSWKAGRAVLPESGVNENKL